MKSPEPRSALDRSFQQDRALLQRVVTEQAAQQVLQPLVKGRDLVGLHEVPQGQIAPASVERALFQKEAQGPQRGQVPRSMCGHVGYDTIYPTWHPFLLLLPDTK